MPELRSCPFCGADGNYERDELGMLKLESDLVRGAQGPTPRYYILCVGCHTRGPTAVLYPDTAVRRWNQRGPMVQEPDNA
jgi:hypothetical protein